MKGEKAMQFLSFTGTVKEIQSFENRMNGNTLTCMQMFTVEGEQGEIVNFLVSPQTYFVHHEMIRKGDQITSYYDANAPAPLIYPPQYYAIVIAKENPQYFVKVAYFNNYLVSSDGQLQLNKGRETRILLENGQKFEGAIQNHHLVVLYGPTTRSIPAQTTPYEIIVLCR